MLDLSETRCRALQSNAFAYFHNLEELRLENCSFMNISSDSLSGLSHLKRLFLRGTGLRTLEILDGIATNGSLEEIDLGNNRISSLNNLLRALSRFRLKAIAIDGNPVCRTAYAEPLIEDHLQSLCVLNGAPVSEEIRSAIIQRIEEEEKERAE